MKCFNPYFRKFEGYSNPFPLPCGQCPACRYNQARDWSLRLQLESMEYNYDEIYFLTLTYDSASVPSDYSLDNNAISGFIKRFRKHIPYKIRFFGCGEYGERFSRPHYHIILFGVKDVNDLRFVGASIGQPVRDFHAWKKGFVQVERPRSVDSVAAYIAQYVTKKQKYESYFPRVAPYHRQSLGFGLEFVKRLPFYTPFIIMNGYQRYLGKYLRYKLAEIWNLKEQVAENGKRFLDDTMSLVLGSFKDLRGEYKKWLSHPVKRVLKFAIEKAAYFEYYSGELELQTSKLKLQKVRLDL